MNINPKTARIIGLPSIYIIAFYSFSGSSLFDYIKKLSGSGLTACMYINVSAALLILLAMLLKIVKTDRLVYTISFLYLLPSVLSHSKLDLIAIVLGIKFKESHHAMVTALCAVFVTAAAIFISRLSVFHEENEKWLCNGAEYKDAGEVYKRRVEMLVFTMSAVLIPLVLIIISGFSIAYFVSSPLEPLILIIAGTVLAAAGIIYLARSTLLGKRD